MKTSLKELKRYVDDKQYINEFHTTEGRMFMLRDIAEFWKRPEREDYEMDIDAYLYGRVFEGMRSGGFRADIDKAIRER